MASVYLHNLNAAYGATLVVKDLSLHIRNGECLALLGPSGCGKTTVLKIIAGLLQPTSGDVRFAEESVRHIPAERRGAVMVFQKPLLFPYLTVAENIAFGLKMRQTPKDDIRQQVTEALRLVQLEGYEWRRPNELSGGQEQRVSLARALVTQPRVLLLDEPFSALDESLRAEMRLFVRALQQQLGITTVFVTHDQAEAAALADRIALLLNGRLEQCGAPREFYTSPATPQAAQFFGWKLIEGRRNGRLFDTAIGRFILPKECAEAVTIMALHSGSVKLRAQGSEFLADSANHATGRIESLLDLGTRIHYRVRLASGDHFEVEQPINDPLLDQIIAPGTQVVLRIPNQNTRFFSTDNA